jgi:hypothetical protein
MRRLRNRFMMLGDSIRRMEAPKPFAAMKAGSTKKALGRLQGAKIFEISASLSRALPDPEHRIVLHRRLRSYAFTHRRGRLRLPQYFPAEVRDLVNLTKRQVREMLYWVKPGTALMRPLGKREQEFVEQHSAVPIWSRQSGADCHMAHSVGLYRLSKSDSPSCGRGLWPSAPSFTEMLEMSRRGIPVTPGLHYRPVYTVKHCLNRQALSNDIRLASRIVAKQVVGIRSSVEIPEVFLPWFRYREGWCILSVRHNLPSGLVRFLLGQWKRRHVNLWLMDHCSLKIFLRKHTAVDFVKHKIDTSTCGIATMPTGGSGMSSPTTTSRTLKSMHDFVGELCARGLETLSHRVYPNWTNDTVGYAWRRPRRCLLVAR